MKAQVTKKQVMENYSTVISAPYCALQYLLNDKTPDYYISSTKYGWRADVYEITPDTAIVTGYSPFGNITADYDTLISYESNAFNIVTNLKLSADDQRKALSELLRDFVTETKNKETKSA